MSETSPVPGDDRAGFRPPVRPGSEERSEGVRGSGLSEPTLDERLAAAREENQRLKWIRELEVLVEARYRELENPFPMPTIGTTSIAAGGITPIKPKPIRPEKMRPYKSEREEEHIRRFHDAEVKVLMSPDCSTTDSSELINCMQSLERNPAN